jgi:hypothetical protein
MSAARNGIQGVGPVYSPLAVSRREAAAMLGLSLSSFERHVQPFLRLAYVGRLRLVPVVELERVLEASTKPSAVESIGLCDPGTAAIPAFIRPRGAVSNACPVEGSIDDP